MNFLGKTIVCFLVICMTGCTFTFKGTDIEAEGGVVRSYELESASVLVANSEPEKNRLLE